ncbi:hypothetical protein ACIQCD_08990 [Streptomyces sp. NPDC093250]|uniref:hypothetical protein n=1 Tax=unclassified Streptomyces TaxID=2593676 RepID=UPI0034014B99
MNLVPQVATAEISDAELDHVSGGQAGAGANLGLGVSAEGGAVGMCIEAGDVCITAGAGGSVSAQGVSLGGNLNGTLY